MAFGRLTWRYSLRDGRIWADPAAVLIRRVPRL